MAPEIYQAFARAFVAEWNREQGQRSVEQDARRDEMKRLKHKVTNLVAAIAESGGSAALYAALREAEGRHAVLDGELATAETPMPRLMPNLADLYRTQVAALQDALSGEDAAAARERVRAWWRRSG